MLCAEAENIPANNEMAERIALSLGHGYFMLVL